MSKQHKYSNTHEMDQKRLTTAPIRQRPKYNDIYKISNMELPAIKGKNFTRQGKRSKKQQVKFEQEHQEVIKRPQTSKGSRRNKALDSEYYEEEGDDLMVTTVQEKVDLFKKLSKQVSKK